MEKIVEILFDCSYLISVITMGIIMIRKSNNSKQIKLFGIMAVILGLGDSFHLVPRVYALSTDGLENHYGILGFGTFVASISMTVFYVILYHIARIRYSFNILGLTSLIYLLAFVRIVLCLFPQNEWMAQSPSFSWAIYRNIPFLLLGLLIIKLFARETKKFDDKPFKWMWLAITLSFAFYIPVVIWSETYPLVGVLMIPKTIAYVWIVIMGFKLIKGGGLEMQNKDKVK